jgi:hypothetical protein
MKKVIAFVIAAMVACPAVILADGAAEPAAKVKGSKSNTSERAAGDSAGTQDTTVKSGKSNTSDRTADGAQKGTTVKSSKSNSSE